MLVHNRIVGFIVGAVVPATALTLLEFAARHGGVNPVFLPAPSAIFTTFLHIVTSGAVTGPLTHTLSLLMAGYALGCALAIVLGVLMGYSRAVFNLFEPLVELLRPIPKPALLPPLMLFFGLGATTEVIIVALGCFFPVLINTSQGVRSLDPTLINTARTFGHSSFSVLWRILLPASAPYILSGMRISLGLGLILVVVSEMLSGSGGLGDAILSAQRSFLVKESYGWLVVLALFGLLLAAFFNWVEKSLIFWSAQAPQ